MVDNTLCLISRQEIGDCHGVVCFLDKLDGSDLVLCVKHHGKDRFCPLDLQADGKYVKYSITKNTIKNEKDFVQYNVNQISGNNEWQNKQSHNLSHTMNTKDHQIQENKRGPDVCPGFGNGARKRKKRNESKAKKKERNKKEEFFRNTV